MPCVRCLFAGLLLCVTLARLASAEELQIARIVMPDAGPSSFAIGFPNGVGFCWDPVRGGLDYAWRGGFADLSPARPGTGKLIKPANLPQAPLYRETGASPLRAGLAEQAAEIAFKGYRLLSDAIEFRYMVDGRLVREEIRALPHGAGLSRRFILESPESDSTWWYIPGPTEGPAQIVVSANMKRENGRYRIEPGPRREFTVEIRFPAGGKD